MLSKSTSSSFETVYACATRSTVQCESFTVSAGSMSAGRLRLLVRSTSSATCSICRPSAKHPAAQGAVAKGSGDHVPFSLASAASPAPPASPASAFL